MELESTNSGPTAKLPILKLGEYEMWAIKIKQYFQIQDYALWEVIENGDSMGFPVQKTVGTSNGGQNLAFMTAPSSSSTNDANTTCSQDLEQIHEDDLEAMDLKWQLSLLSVRAKKYYQRTGCTAPKGKEGSIRSDMANNKFNKQGLKVIVIPQRVLVTPGSVVVTPGSYSYYYW
ncbi:hypothetical protein Tco_0211162 [Tanacetum coccineum]